MWAFFLSVLRTAPANTGRCPNAGSMLVRRRRLRTSIELTLGHRPAECDDSGGCVICNYLRGLRGTRCAGRHVTWLHPAHATSAHPLHNEISGLFLLLRRRPEYCRGVPDRDQLLPASRHIHREREREREGEREEQQVTRMHNVPLPTSALYMIKFQTLVTCCEYRPRGDADENNPLHSGANWTGLLINSFVAGPDYICFLHFSLAHYISAFIIKRKINQQYLKIVEFHFIKSE